jgi:hypothetical protein
MNKWVEEGAGLGVGLVGGVLDRVAANKDAKDKAAFAAVPANAGKTYPAIKQWGTWINYALPAVEVLAAGVMAYKKTTPDFWDAVLVTQAGGLFGGKMTANMTKKNYVLNYVATPATWTAEMEAARRAAALAHRDAYVPQPNPQPITTTPDISNVVPQGLQVGQGFLG